MVRLLIKYGTNNISLNSKYSTSKKTFSLSSNSKKICFYIYLKFLIEPGGILNSSQMFGYIFLVFFAFPLLSGIITFNFSNVFPGWGRLPLDLCDNSTGSAFHLLKQLPQMKKLNLFAYFRLIELCFINKYLFKALNIYILMWLSAGLPLCGT